MLLMLIAGSRRRFPMENVERMLARMIDTKRVSCMLFIPRSRSGWSSCELSIITADDLRVAATAALTFDISSDVVSLEPLVDLAAESPQPSRSALRLCTRS